MGARACGQACGHGLLTKVGQAAALDAAEVQVVQRALHVTQDAPRQRGRLRVAGQGRRGSVATGGRRRAAAGLVTAHTLSIPLGLTDSSRMSTPALGSGTWQASR